MPAIAILRATPLPGTGRIGNPNLEPIVFPGVQSAGPRVLS